METFRVINILPLSLNFDIWHHFSLQNDPKRAKICNFGENGQTWVILGAQMASYVKIWGNLSNNLFHKVSKIYFSQIYAQKLAKVILGFNLVKISHLVKIVKIGSVWWPIWRHMSKFGENCQIIFSLKVSKNYYSQVYWDKLGHKCHWWGPFAQNRSLLVEMVKIWLFWGQNDVIGQNLGKEMF